MLAGLDDSKAQPAKRRCKARSTAWRSLLPSVLEKSLPPIDTLANNMVLLGVLSGRSNWWRPVPHLLRRLRKERSKRLTM